MKYDATNLAIVSSNIVTIVYVICAFIGAIVSVCVKLPAWTFLFVGSAFVVSLSQIFLCAFRYSGDANKNSPEESK